MTGNINLQDFTSFHTNFLDFRFQKSSDFIDFKYDFSRSVRDLATVGDPSDTLTLEKVQKQTTKFILNDYEIAIKPDYSS